MPEICHITAGAIDEFRSYLISKEKSEFTISKYLRDVRTFAAFLGGEALPKESVLAFKKHLMDCGEFADSSVNSILSSVQAFHKFIGRADCNVKNIRIQDLPFNPEEKNLTREEFDRLLAAAEGNRRLQLILLVFFATGIRVSELKYFTVESFRSKLDSVRVTVRCKKENHRMLIADSLKQEILAYIRDNRFTSGPIFCTRNGRPLDRSNIWKQMKRLCEKPMFQKVRCSPTTCGSCLPARFMSRPMTSYSLPAFWATAVLIR